MRRAWVEFWTEPQPAYAVGYLELHRWLVERDATADPRAPRVGRWDPPLEPVPGRGWPRIHVEVEDRVILEFVSLLEMETAARVLATPLVDHETAKARWYRKLPASVKAARARERAADRIREAAAAYERRLPSIVAAPSPVPPARAERPPVPGAAGAPVLRSSVDLLP